MTNRLQIQDLIDKKSLDPSHYFQSLLAKASAAGLLENVEEIRREAVLLSVNMAKRFTLCASSSVMAETAQGLLESAMYCIGRRLKAVETGEALKQLKTLPLEQIWDEGKELLRFDLAEARSLLDRLRENTFKTENEAYNNTLCGALPAFFAAYDIEYSAHETPCLIDYPLCIEPSRLAGVEHILEYLKRLGMENIFCVEYSDCIDPLLRGYDSGWRNLNINIFELALTNALGRVLCGKDTGGLDISAEDRERLQSSLGAVRTRLKTIVCMTARRVCMEAGLPQTVSSYAQKAAGSIAAQIKNALETGSLSSVFIAIKYESSPIVRFEDADAMTDERFRAVTDEIRSCRHISDKLAMIKQNIMSIADLADMLAASCLFNKEYEVLFRALDVETLALLYKRLPEEGAMHITKGEEEWQRAFHEYLEEKGIKERINKALIQSIDWSG